MNNVFACALTYALFATVALASVVSQPILRHRWDFSDSYNDTVGGVTIQPHASGRLAGGYYYAPLVNTGLNVSGIPTIQWDNTNAGILEYSIHARMNVSTTAGYVKLIDWSNSKKFFVFRFKMMLISFFNWQDNLMAGAIFTVDSSRFTLWLQPLCIQQRTSKHLSRNHTFTSVCHASTHIYSTKSSQHHDHISTLHSFTLRCCLLCCFDS